MRNMFPIPFPASRWMMINYKDTKLTDYNDPPSLQRKDSGVRKKQDEFILENEIQKRIGDEAFSDVKPVTLWDDILHLCRRLVIYIFAAGAGYAAYYGFTTVMNLYESQEKYDAEYQVYRSSVCGLLMAEGFADRECSIPIDRKIDPNYPKNLEGVFNRALNTYGISADLSNVYGDSSEEYIFQKINFHKMTANGSIIAGSKVSLKEVSAAIDGYLKRK